MDAIKLYSIEDDVYKTFNSYVETIRNEGIRLTYSRYAEAIKPELAHFAGTALIYFVGAFSKVIAPIFALLNSSNNMFATFV